jgi:hypothetical protein
MNIIPPLLSKMLKRFSGLFIFSFMTINLTLERNVVRAADILRLFRYKLKTI